MRVYKLLISLAVSSLLFMQCQLDEPLEPLEYYNFKTDLTVKYNTDTISIGDTLWLEGEIGSFLVDSATNKNIHFNSALINLNLMLRAWNADVGNYQPENASIEFITYAGYLSYTDNVTMIGLYYKAKDGKYFLKFGIVFNTQGIYSIDSDYLKFHNYYNNSYQYFGGGLMEFNTLQNETRGAYLKTEMKVDNNNMHLYNELSEIEKDAFQVVNDSNQSKYYFIKVNE
jgi:hypothetical protein